jgi:hypothetical protein
VIDNIRRLRSSRKVKKLERGINRLNYAGYEMNLYHISAEPIGPKVLPIRNRFSMIVITPTQCECRPNAGSRWSSEYFCRSLEHSIASGWKSVIPAPEDGLYAKKPPYKKPKQTKAQIAVEHCERDLQKLRYKRIGTTDKLELERLGKQKEQLIERLGKLEGACKEHSC